MLSVLLVGAGGQLGQALAVSAADVAQGIECKTVTHAELDISDFAAVQQTLQQLKPQLVINAAAYTAVDRAELEPETAYLVNTKAVENLALGCHNINAKLLYISTDFVFSGQARQPQLTTDITEPLSVYGKSKLAGEQAILTLLGVNALVIRSSWLFSEYGHNFVKTMRTKMLAGDALTVVNDQIGSPTYAPDLAEWIWRSVFKFAAGEMHGIYHAANAGQCSWFEFAQAIKNALNLSASKEDSNTSLQPISTAEYINSRNTVIAPRPAYSVLNTDAFFAELQVTPRSWQQALSACITNLAADI